MKAKIKRNYYDFMADIISSAGNGSKKTSIINKLNTDYAIAKKYFEIALEKGYIQVNGNNSIYVKTQKGLQFIKIFKEIETLEKQLTTI